MSVKSYEGQTIWMHFLIGNGDLLEKYNIIWNKVSADIKKEFDSKFVDSKTFFKNKIKSCDDEVTDFVDKTFLRQVLIILV